MDCIEVECSCFQYCFLLAEDAKYFLFINQLHLLLRDLEGKGGVKGSSPLTIGMPTAGLGSCILDHL
jgi:hypothetical protein